MDNKEKKLIGKIFVNNINNKFKSIPFNIHKNHVGESKYFPAAFKEWRNDVYFFNYNAIKNFPVYNININKIIRSYFYSYFFNKFIQKNYVRHKLKRLSLNKIYISRPELRHTNNKVIVTIYAYNKEILSLLSAIDKLKNILYKFSRRYSFFRRRIWKKFLFLNKGFSKFFYSEIKKGKNFNSIIKYRDSKINLYNEIKNKILINFKLKLRKSLLILRKYKLYLNLNKSKFEDIFLYKLGELINRFFNKKIEFNIINLHSIIFHADLFTELLKLKLKRRKRAKVMRAMRFVLNRVDLPRENLMKGSMIKSVDFSLLENRYNNLHLAYLINKNNLYERLKESYNDVVLKKVRYYYNNIVVNNKKSLQRKLFILNIIRFKKYMLKYKIFNSIKYKNLRGIRLEIKGRLTWRYRADRSLYKVLWKGGLKNVDSSFKGLSAVSFRGYTNSNVEYSMRASKRRIGAFAVKGWIAGGK